MTPAQCAWIFERAMERGEYLVRSKEANRERAYLYRWLNKYEALTGDFKFRQLMIKKYEGGLRVVRKNYKPPEAGV